MEPFARKRIFEDDVKGMNIYPKIPLNYTQVIW